MSIKVAIEELATAVAERGPAYLLTTVPDGRPHVMHLQFAVDGGELRAEGLGRTATANIGAQPAVTLLWSPDGDGYSLIVDGEATADGAGGVVVTALDAVLHRPA
ncbi:MAG: pyridoxamine 5'-phosphate oxidase family protein [Acidimicrobiales bacterium]